jgi:two-component system LytT family response regulator
MPRKTLRTLVVDDEPVARRVLLEDLAEIEDVSVIGEADNGKRALQQIEKLRPDLVLLDIQMPIMDGFQVLRQLQGPLPSIIFVTAYSQHALNAFEVGAVDYLLKPVSQDRLQRAVERAQAALGNRREAVEKLAQTLGAAEAGEKRRVVKIAARKGEDYYLLDLDEVFAFQADREIVWIRTRDKSYMATQTLQAIDDRFSGTQFQRVHRSVLVNLDKVRKISVLSSQRWLLTLTNGLEYTVSKRQVPLLRDLLG